MRYLLIMYKLENFLNKFRIEQDNYWYLKIVDYTLVRL
jgi:hypothetical protein